MQDFSARTAFVTGGAAGIGLAIAASLGRRGARVMLADIDADALARAADDLAGQGIAVATTVCDVADPVQMRAAADETVSRLGKVHVLVNNAGVSLDGRTGEIPLEDWRWIVDINLMGVVHGVETFVPLIRGHGEGGHIVNTASIAGHWAVPGGGPYTATKFAVVGYSETLRQELEPEGIGVSVLCPGWVRTGIHRAQRRRPSFRTGTAQDDSALMRQAGENVEQGIDPAIVGEWVADCMVANRLYIFTQPDLYGIVNARAAAIKIDFNACVRDPRFAGDGD
ncbi:MULTISPECIES: SDR family NAD(P)-dependent oxidoreductase [unclassified Roseitalea]|uniref:SDR family NAD(P)-dependent oxidoreductase n=1 Tax=unclassified Roseitalea TaxID=2639107 RepID=UPI0027401E41|nr:MULTISPECIES: SDR family NAD(P)-dependent oxidoreductase [unclassified Roseitalea]